MGKEYPVQFGGILSATICWAVFILADFIDEIILNESIFLNKFVILCGPIAAAVYYIVGCIKNKPDLVSLLFWNIKFYVSAIVISVPICMLVIDNNWIIFQAARGSFINLNGVEYLVFTFWFFGSMLIITVIFHIVYAIVKAVRKNKANN